MTDSPIQVGGAYVENEGHVPNPTDMVAQFNTSGTGAHGKIEEVAPVFTVDKVKTAQEIVAALDPENTLVSESKVLLPDPIGDNDFAREDALRRAEARIAEGVVIGGATPAEEEAAAEGDEGTALAVDQERRNAASNSTGTTNAGQHDGDVTSDAGVDDTKRVGAPGLGAVGKKDGSEKHEVKGAGEGSAKTKEAKKDDDAKDGDDDLKGEALEEALTQRGLPHTGTADEKRDRVKEHDAKGS